MTLDPVAEGDPHVPAHNSERDAINQLNEDLLAKISSPTLKPLGSILRWDGDNWVASKLRLFEGNGSPQGVVAAPVGSRYIDAVATGGISEYFKVSGVGNTGWVPAYQDTGWVTITPGTGYIHGSEPAGARMINDVVYLRGVLVRTSGSGTTAGTIPTAMRPDELVAGTVRNATPIIDMKIETNGAIIVDTSVNTGSGLYLKGSSCSGYKRT